MTDFMLKKITAKNIEANKVGTGFRIIGRVMQIKPGKTQYGDFARLCGAFEATTFKIGDDGVVTPTGNKYSSAVAIMPPVIEPVILASLAALQDKNATASLEMAYDVMLKKAENQMGKEWTATALIKARPEQDPLAALRLALAPPNTDNRPPAEAVGAMKAEPAKPAVIAKKK